MQMLFVDVVKKCRVRISEVVMNDSAQDKQLPQQQEVHIVKNQIVDNRSEYDLRVRRLEESVEGQTGLTLRDAFDVFLGNKEPETIAAYESDWRQFALFVGKGDMRYGAEKFFNLKPLKANSEVMKWLNQLSQQGLAPKTVHRKLAAVKGLVKAARICEICSFHIDVESPLGTEPEKDLRGDGFDGFLSLFRRVRQRNDIKGVRDQALVMLMWSLALRRVELVRLDFDDWDSERSQIWIWGKKRHQKQKEPMTVVAAPKAFLDRWVEVRGDAPGALFHSLRPNRTDPVERLKATSLNWLFNGWTDSLGLKRGVHRWRHASITHALDESDGDVRAVQKFARHKSLTQTQVYDDSRQDFAGQMSEKVTSSLPADFLPELPKNPLPPKNPSQAASLPENLATEENTEEDDESYY